MKDASLQLTTALFIHLATILGHIIKLMFKMPGNECVDLLFH
jgi:hypothetical protein